MSRIKKIFEKDSYIILFLAIFIISMTISWNFNEESLYYDAKNYWEIGKAFWDPEVAASDSRGFLYPCVLGLIQKLGGWNLYRVLNSAFISLSFTVLLPKLFGSDVWDARGHIIRVLGAYILFTVLFTDVQVSSLSDLPAFVCGCCACYILQNIIKRKDIDKIHLFFLSILMGGGGYGAYNI